MIKKLIHHQKETHIKENRASQAHTLLKLLNIKLIAELTSNPQFGISNIKQNPKILLLQIGNHIQHRVHIIGRRRHRQTSHRTGAAVNQTVFHRQFQIQSTQMERYARCRYLVARRETRVESSQRRKRTAHLLSKLVSNRRVDRGYESGYYGPRVDNGSRPGVRVEPEEFLGDWDEDSADADSG